MPRAIKLLRGTFRKDRAPEKIPEPPAGNVKRPASLNAREKRIWAGLAPWLEDQGLLTKADAAAFERYVFWAAQFDELKGLCRKHGIAVAIREGYRTQLLKASVEMGKAEAKFGLSPADRERIGAQPSSTPSDKVEDFLFGDKDKRAKA